MSQRDTECPNAKHPHRLSVPMGVSCCAAAARMPAKACQQLLKSVARETVVLLAIE
jgi:hypothetical protein